MVINDNGEPLYMVVINYEEQYSIYPVNRHLPLGMKPAGKTGTLKECENYIRQVWTDMRPLSVRKQLELE